MIGERIKALRKERKMTQTDLADGIVTKSMLSMIENGKAEASMRSLREIAERLDVPLQSLLADPKEDELRQVVQEIEYLADAKKDMPVEEVINRLLPFLDSVQDSIWKGKALTILAFSYANLKERDKVSPLLSQAISLFERLGEKDEMAMASVLDAYFLLQWDRYDEAIEKIDVLSQVSVSGMKPNTRVEFYMLLVFKELLYEDNTTLAMKYLEEGLAYMKSINTYYRADDFYRLIASLATDDDNVELYNRSIKKARQFVAFTESPSSQLHLIYTESMFSIEKRDVKNLRAQYDRVCSFDLSQEHDVPKFFIGGILHALEGNPALAQEAFEDLWNKRESWKLHSQLDQIIYLEGLLLGTELGCGDQWVKEIQLISEKLPNNRYKKRLLKRLDKIKKEER